MQVSKFIRKIKLGIGLVAGLFLGLIYAPKRGKEIRDYCTSSECQTKLHNAQNRIKGLKDKLRRAIQKTKNKFD